MTQYQILRWDVVTDCNDVLRPMLYFKPDTNIVLQTQNNKNYLYLNIGECQFYSGTMIPVIIDIASQQPNFRPNFFQACHLYTATLIKSAWYGFPMMNLGRFVVYDGPIIPTCWRGTNMLSQQSENFNRDDQTAVPDHMSDYALSPEETSRSLPIPTAPGDIMAGVPAYEKEVSDANPVAANNADVQIPDDQKKKAQELIDQNHIINQELVDKSNDCVDRKELIDASNDSQSQAETAENILMPRFDAQQPKIPEACTGKVAEFYENKTCSPTSKGLQTGLIILMIILIIGLFVLLIRKSKKNGYVRQII